MQKLCWHARLLSIRIPHACIHFFSTLRITQPRKVEPGKSRTETTDVLVLRLHVQVPENISLLVNLCLLDISNSWLDDVDSNFSDKVDTSVFE